MTVIIAAIQSRPAVARPCLSLQRNARIGVSGLRKQRTLVRADKTSGATEMDFDAFLNSLAEKWEQTDNKPVVVGYIAAAATAIFVSEWLIHLPLFNVVLGFPIQLLGLLLLPYFGVRYFVEDKSVSRDVEAALNDITARLPGLEKK